jgi:hypothetical protein
MKAAHILDGKIINVIEVESLTSFTPSEGTIENLPEGAWINYVQYDGIWKLDIDIATKQEKQRREELLVESDIAMLPDNYAKLSDEKKIEWATYRQALRDLPTQEGFPWDVKFPTKPTKE